MKKFESRLISVGSAPVWKIPQDVQGEWDHNPALPSEIRQSCLNFEITAFVRREWVLYDWNSISSSWLRRDAVPIPSKAVVHDDDDDDDNKINDNGGDQDRW